MKQKIFFLHLFIFGILSVAGQKTIRGIIYDSQSKKTLAFANIITANNSGSVSDFDGKFEIKIPENTGEISVSYIGYETKKVSISAQKDYYTIYLKPVAESLGEVVINGKYVNPAVVLMKKAIKSKKYNDFRQKLPQYAYTKYMKLVVDVDIDKIDREFDTIYKEKKILKIDSSLYKLKKEYADKNIWLLENIIKINGNYGKEKKEIIATHTAGLKNPVYEFLAFQANNQEVYDDYYKFLLKKYLGPFSKLSIKQYQYEIDDTINIQGRPVIEVSYKNMQKPLISGKIYLDIKTLAIAKMTLNTYKNFQLNAVYNFKYYPGRQVWFPLTTDIFVKKAERKNAINFGNVITIKSQRDDNKNDSLIHTNKHTTLDYTYAKFIIRNSHIKLNENYPEKLKYDLEIHPLATKRKDDFWQQYSGIKPDIKEKNTYKYIDSISEKENFEKDINKIKKLSNGYLPVNKYFDMDLIDVLDYNQYEGLRIKLGGKTTENLLKKLIFSTYAAYGFKDKELKYSAGLRYKLFHRTQTYIGVDYTKDLSKSGALYQAENRNIFSLPKHFSHDKFYMETGFSGTISHLLSPVLQTDLQFTMAELETKFPIPYHKGRLEFAQKDIAYLRFTSQWTPFAQYYLSPQGRKMLKDGYPKIYLSIEKNFPDLQTDQTDYFRMDIQFHLKKTYINKDATELMFRTGFASIGTGIDKLYSPNTNDYYGSNPFNRFNLSQPFAFETMKDYEFSDNILLTAHLIHHFNHIKLGVTKQINVNLIGRFAYGLRDYTNTYTGIDSLDRVYFETGLEINKLIWGMGLGFYYRLGNYAYPDALDNLSIRLTFKPGKLFDK